MRTSRPQAVDGAPRGGHPFAAVPAPVEDRQGAGLARLVGMGRLRLPGGSAEGLVQRAFERLRVTAVGADEPALPLPVAGSRTLLQPLRVVVVIDESGSTSSSDPGRESHRATLLVCAWLAQHSQCGSDEIGVVRFADRAAATGPFAVGRSEASVGRALARRVEIGGGTRLTPAIDKAVRLCAGAGRQRRVVLLMTDGQVAEADAALRQLFGQLRAHAQAIHLLALDWDGTWTRSTHGRYQSLGLSGQTPIRRRSSQVLAVTLANVLAHEAGLAIQQGGR